MTKLDWQDARGTGTETHQLAEYRGLIIRAMHDPHPFNPFTDDDGHWPMLTLYDRSLTNYRLGSGAWNPIAEHFIDYNVVLFQKQIAKELEDSCWGYFGDHDDSGLEEAAMCEADALIAEIGRNATERLKQMIRAKAPLHVRQQVLAEIRRIGDDAGHDD